MKVLLKIGHTCLLLPDDKNITTVMKALGRAIEVDDYTWDSEDRRVIFEREAHISMKLLTSDVKITGIPRAPKAKPLALNEPRSILL